MFAVISIFGNNILRALIIVSWLLLYIDKVGMPGYEVNCGGTIIKLWQQGSYLADSASSHDKIVVNSFEISGSSCHYLAGHGLGSPSGTHKFGLLYDYLYNYITTCLLLTTDSGRGLAILVSIWPSCCTCTRSMQTYCMCVNKQFICMQSLRKNNFYMSWYHNIISNTWIYLFTQFYNVQASFYFSVYN